MLFMSSLGVGHRSGTHGVGVVRSRGSEEGSVGSLGVWTSGVGVERSNLFVSKLQTFLVGLKEVVIIMPTLRENFLHKPKIHVLWPQITIS